MRYAAAGAAAPRGAAIAAGHTATDQVETVLYRLAASPGRRALLGHARARRARWCGRCSRSRARRRRRTAPSAACRGARTRPTTRRAYARNRVRAGLLPALRALHPAAEANVLRTLAPLRDEAAVLDAAVDARARRDEQAALAALPPALARLCLQRLADEAAAPAAAPAVGPRAAELLALGGGGGSAALDLGGGLRAVAEYGRLRFERGAAPRAAGGPRGSPCPAAPRSPAAS